MRKRNNFVAFYIRHTPLVFFGAATIVVDSQENNSLLK